MTTPTHLERQLRAGLARLMAAETHPAARMAQIRWIEALLTIETLAALLAIIDAQTPTEEALSALLPGAWYMDPPDGGDTPLMTQLQRMADDAAKWRAWVRQNPPPVPMPPPLSFAGASPFPGNPAAQPVPLVFTGPGAPVYENPASKREPQRGMPGYNNGSKREDY